MNVYEAVILGIIQGATEFLPVSSSGHLIIAPLLLGYKSQPLSFDTTMHIATALALLVFFWRDLYKLVNHFIKDLLSKGISLNSYTKEGKLLMYMLVGCIPAGLVGYAYGDVIEQSFRGVFWVALFLICGSFLMGLGDAYFWKFKKNQQLSFGKSLIIGMFQALALFPGISRSGSTMSGGMLTGLSREEATRFSFLVSIPIVILAGGLQIFRSPGDFAQVGYLPIALGFMASFLTGLAALVHSWA